MTIIKFQISLLVCNLVLCVIHVAGKIKRQSILLCTALTTQICANGVNECLCHTGHTVQNCTINGVM